MAVTAFIFLDLLETHAQRVCEVSLRQAKTDPTLFDPAADLLVCP
ncbi:MAG: hypothetical protein AAF234_05825 [Pseudomonadota bacterium]